MTDVVLLCSDASLHEAHQTRKERNAMVFYVIARDDGDAWMTSSLTIDFVNLGVLSLSPSDEFTQAHLCTLARRLVSTATGKDPNTVCVHPLDISGANDPTKAMPSVDVEAWLLEPTLQRLTLRHDGTTPLTPLTTDCPWALVHVPRTGGTAIEMSALKHNILWGYFKSKHAQSALSRTILWHRPPSAAGGIFYPSHQKLFAVVRDPTDRAISAYTYHCARQKTTPTSTGLNAYLKYMLSRKGHHNLHFQRQVDLVHDPKRPVDRIFRYEDGFPDVVNDFFKEEELPMRVTSRYNSGGTKVGRADLNATSVSLLRQWFAKDYADLNYTPPQAPPRPVTRHGRRTRRRAAAAAQDRWLGAMTTREDRSAVRDDGPRNPVAPSPPPVQIPSATTLAPLPPSPPSFLEKPAPACFLASMTYVQRCEHSYLREFVSWYITVVGVEQVHFISTDRCTCPAFLLHEVQRGRVFWHFLEDECYRPNGEPNGHRFYETDRLRAFVNREMRNAKWVLYVDSDEYLVTAPDISSLRQWLQGSAGQQADTYLLRWYVFAISKAHADGQLSEVTSSWQGAANMTSLKYVTRPEAIEAWKPHTPFMHPGGRRVMLSPMVAFSVHCAARCVEHVIVKQLTQAFADSKCQGDRTTVACVEACLADPIGTHFNNIPIRMCDYYCMTRPKGNSPVPVPMAWRAAVAQRLASIPTHAFDVKAALPEELRYLADDITRAAPLLARRRPLAAFSTSRSRMDFTDMCRDGNVPDSYLTADGRGEGLAQKSSGPAQKSNAPAQRRSRAPVPSTVMVGRRARRRYMS